MHAVDSGIAAFLSLVASNINYSGFVKDFINKKHILESKNELQVAIQKLQEYEKLRTNFLQIYLMN